ncbi:MAG: cation:proton antiporter [Chloroflexi bacterium]|nr:cation:proton antiporter [Chloroflexota bacterium]
MTDVNILVNVILVLGAAVVGGALALRLKQPVILGYLVAGLIVGPFTPGPQADFDQFRFLTEVGLGLLLFVLGAGLPPSRFRGLGTVIVLGGAIQITLVSALGFLFMLWFSLSLAQAFLLGAILAQSSSAVIAKVLDDRNETESVHGRIAVGMSVVQDLSSLPLLLLLLVFLGQNDVTLSSFIVTIGEVFGIAIFMYVIGKVIWPRFLEWIGYMGSDELTILVALLLALGGGLLLQQIGLSFTLGAFLAGLVIAESPQRQEAVSRMLPLRDVFAAMFFVSIGALFNPSVLWQLPIPLIGLLSTLVIGKALITGVVVRTFGQSASTAILTGLLLAQIGEFAFILANIGLEHGAITQELFSLIIAAAVISIFINSLILDSAPPVLVALARIMRFNALLKQPPGSVTSTFRRGRSMADGSRVQSSSFQSRKDKTQNHS